MSAHALLQQRRRSSASKLSASLSFSAATQPSSSRDATTPVFVDVAASALSATVLASPPPQQTTSHDSERYDDDVWTDAACLAYACPVSSGHSGDEGGTHAAWRSLWSDATQHWARQRSQRASAEEARREQERTAIAAEDEKKRQRMAERVRRLAAEMDSWASEEAARAREEERETERRRRLEAEETARRIAERRATPQPQPDETTTQKTAASSSSSGQNTAPSVVVGCSHAFACVSSGRLTPPLSSTPPLISSTDPTVLPAVGALYWPTDLPDIAHSLQISFFAEQTTRAYARRAYADAIRFLTDALESLSRGGMVAARVALLGNRSLCHLQLGMAAKSLADATSALALKPRHALSAWRAARAALFLGQIDKANVFLEIVGPGKLTPSDAELFSRYAEYHTAFTRGQLADALSHIEAVCTAVGRDSPGASSVFMELRRLQCMAELSLEDAITEATALCAVYPRSAALWALRGQLHFRNATSAAELAAAVASLRTAAEGCSNPSDDAATVTAAARLAAAIAEVCPIVSALEAAYAGRKWSVVLSRVNQLMQADLVCHGTLRGVCLLKRARALYERGAFPAALASCVDAALSLMISGSSNGGEGTAHAELLTLRGECHAKMGNWQEAVADVLEAARLRPSPDAFDTLERLRSAAAFSAGNHHNHSRAVEDDDGEPWVPPTRHAARPPSFKTPPSPHHNRPKPPHAVAFTATHYDTLGVATGADAAAIAKAYRVAALRWHPDRWVAKGAAFRREAEERFKLVNHAHSVLCDAAARRMYDRTVGVQPCAA